MSISANSQQTAAVALAAALKRHGVSVLFGQSLPSALHLAAPDFGLHQVNYRAENAGGVMADGYARITNKIGVVTAQNGPAATLLVAPMAEAMKASVPLLAIVQEVNRDQIDRNAFQEFDHFGLFSSCAKWIRRIELADRVDDYVDMAIVAATTGRPGPVVLLCPADMLNDVQEVSQARAATYGNFPLDRVAPDPARTAQAARLLANARHPLVIVGGGVHLSGASAELVALQESCSLPVGTTNMGKGSVAETHELSLGVLANALGTNSPARPFKKFLDRADVVLLVGTRTNQNGTDSWKLYPRNARFIHLDVDGTEVGRNYEALRLVGDAKLGLAALAEALRDAGLEARRDAREGLVGEIAELRAQGRREAEAVTSDKSTPLRPEFLMAELDRHLQPGDIVAADASYSSLWVLNFLTAREAGQRFLTPRGIAGLGWGLPLALGAKVGAGARRVIAVVGDGGFAHTWQELETARRMGLAVTVIVLNNGILGFQKHAELVKFGAHTSAIDFLPVDHAAIAQATGCRGVRVDTAEGFAAALADALASDVTTVLDVTTSPDAYPPISVFEDKL